jgi:hypothetical protein
MAQRRGEGAELRSCSYLGQYDATQWNDRRRDSQEHRVQSVDRGFWLQTGCSVKVFSCGEAEEDPGWVQARGVEGAW